MFAAMIVLALVGCVFWLLALAALDWKPSGIPRLRRLGFESCERRIVLAPVASVTAVDALEGGEIWVTVQLNEMAEQAGSVDLTAVGLTATPGDDFYIVGGTPGVYTTTVTFAQWDMMQTVYIGTVNDSLYEGNESLRLDLSNPINLTLSPTQSSVTVQIIDDEINWPPSVSTIPDQYRWTEDDDEIVISLVAYFSDSNDPLSSLTWNVTPSGTSGLSSYFVDSCQFLHLSYTPGVAGVSNIVVRGTDPQGAWAETDFDGYSVAVTGFDLERFSSSGWVAVDPATEVLWDDDELRWTAQIAPNIPSLAVTTEWLASPWPGDYYTGGVSFAIQSGLQPATGNPGMGNHAITPRVILPNAKAVFLAAPEEAVIASIVSIDWKQHDFGDNAGDYVPGGNSNGHGGDLIYAEKPYAEAWSPLHDKIDVEVTIAWGGGVRPATNVFLRVFDPDHDSSDNDFDGNGSTPGDNRAKGGAIATPAASFDSATVHFDPVDTVNRATLTIEHRRPGNNFIVVGAGRQDRSNDAIFLEDGVTLWDTAKLSVVPAEATTDILTVWRTLHVEEDSMDCPAGCPMYTMDTFDGAGVGNDDVDPLNLGTNGGAGDFVQPSLALLTSEFARGHVRVVTISTLIDDDDDIAFVHNLTSSYYGDAIRDVPSQPNYWTLQVLAAYEGSELLDGDDGDLEAWGGKTSLLLEGPVYVFLEVLRDVNAELPGTVDTERLRQRTVVHETLHRFDYAAHDVSIMNADIFWSGTDAENALVGKLLRALRDNDIR